MGKILVTGGAGFIGSHTCVELLNAGYDVVVVDNLSNSSKESLARVESITNKKVDFIEGDVRDKALIQSIFVNHSIDAVIHFAGYKAVGESCQLPLKYYDNNLQSTLVLAQVMQEVGVKKLVFSSSATVYGEPEVLPLTEDLPLSAANPYGRSKLIIEEMLRDLPLADKLNQESTPWQIVLLRYFNPVGAHESGTIGEDPKDIPNNLMPYITQVAVGKLKQLSVFGGDYPTPDGTGVRDYIHVVDLAKGHVKSIDNLLGNNPIQGVEAINLGTGTGLSVLDLVNGFINHNEVDVPYSIVDRRPGDAASCYADVSKAKKLLDWQAEKTVKEMVQDSWRWQQQNPNGFE